MALPGMKSTSDFSDTEALKSWREGILRYGPRDQIGTLYALTSQMKSEKVGWPEFDWAEEQIFMYNFTVNGALILTDTTVTIDSGATRLKPGDMLKVTTTDEHVRVISVVSDTVFTIERARGAAGSAAGTAGAIADNAVLLYIGSAYREGAPVTIGTSGQPNFGENYCQIFRDPVEITRTAQQSTTYRFGDPFAEDKQRASHKHSLGVEMSFLFGAKYKTFESSQPIRWTGGITSFIPTENRVSITGGVMDMDELESLFPRIFMYGSSNKVAFGSIQSLSLLSTLVRKNGMYEWQNGQKEYGLDVRKFITPAGTLSFIEHPLFSLTPYMQQDLLIIDTAKLRYRYLQDTTYLKNRQSNGTDGQTDEFLTEAGLEVHQGPTHFWLQGLTAVAKDAA